MSTFMLGEFVIVLAASVAVLLISHRLRLPSVVGFLITGILIGPAGLQLVRNTEMINVMAEVGVMMLLFTVGLEFPLQRIGRIRKDFWIGGGMQVLLTTAGAAAILTAAGVPPHRAIFYGFLASPSSTALLMKVLSDRGETDAPYGRTSLAISIFQDLTTVPMLILVPVLAGVGAADPLALAARFGLNLAAITAAVAVAYFLLPRFFHVIVRTRVRETFLIASLGAALGFALLTSAFGLSLALGAFLAGILMARSTYSHQVAAEIVPFRNLFLSLFFVSIGMLFSFGGAWAERGLVASLVIFIIILKFGAVFVAARVVRHSARVALLSGVALAQISEFSFVLALAGRAVGLLPQSAFQGFIAAAVLTMMINPILLRLAPAVAEWAERSFGWRPRPATGEGPRRGPHGHVIIAGFGINGRNLARVLKAAGIPYVILELSPDAVRQAAEAGEPILFGDVSSGSILREAGICDALTIVFAISDPQASRRGVMTARRLNKRIHVIVRTRYEAEIEELYRLGANEVIPEEFETSIEIFTRVLEEYHVPRNLVDAQVKVIRGERYGLLRGAGQVRPSMEKIAEILTAGTAETFFVGRESRAAGRTLQELDLRRRTDATVIAVVREETSFTSPPPDFRIEPNDTLVLVASHAAMMRAFEFLGEEGGGESGVETASDGGSGGAADAGEGAGHAKTEAGSSSAEAGSKSAGPGLWDGTGDAGEPKAGKSE